MGITETLSVPLYGGVGISEEVPGKWDCCLNGRTYMYDWKYVTQFRRQSVALLKPQQDQSGNVSEQSLNPEEFPRRSQETWHRGAGQIHADLTDSDPGRFRSSKGVDVWTKWQLSLLPDTAQKRASANTNLGLAVAGTRLYVTDGNDVRYTTDVTIGAPVWTLVTGLPAANPSSIASDGFTVWTTHGANGIYKTTRTSGNALQVVTTAVGASAIVAYVKGRWMVADGPSLYNVTNLAGPAAMPAALYTQPNTDWTWVGFAEGPSNIYAAGFSGDKSLIYRTTIKADGTALDVPVVAGELPDGEIVRAIQGYLGFLLIGTDKGVRFATLDTPGNLDIGPLIPTSAAVQCFEPQDSFVWFGWTNYDATSTGLGRLNLGTFTGTGPTEAPAYASDLMVTGQGAVVAVATFQNIRVCAVSALGIYAQDPNKVPTGTLDSGLFSYGMVDPKVAMYVTLLHRPLVGSVSESLAADGGAFTVIGTGTTAGSTIFTSPGGQVRGETFELRLTLNREPTATTTGPSIIRQTLEVNPAPGRGEVFTVPFLLFDTVRCNDGDEPMDPKTEYLALLDMETSGAPLTFGDAGGSYTVFLDDHEIVIDGHTQDKTFFNCTFLARLRRPRQRST